jgi:hypothetical protein
MKEGMDGKNIDPVRGNSFDSKGSEVWKNDALIRSE